MRDFGALTVRVGTRPEGEIRDENEGQRVGVKGLESRGCLEEGCLGLPGVFPDIF